MIPDQTQCYLLTSQWSVPGAQEPRDRGDSSPTTSGGPRGGGAFGSCPPKFNHRWPIYLCPLQTRAGPLDPLGPLAEVDFLPDFRTPPDGSGPRGKHQGSAPMDEPGTRKTNRGVAGRIRAPEDESGPRRTYQGPAGRIRAPQDESGPHVTNQDPPGRSRSPTPHIYILLIFYFVSEFRPLPENSGPNSRSISPRVGQNGLHPAYGFLG